jgi:hypothetical protein
MNLLKYVLYFISLTLFSTMNVTGFLPSHAKMNSWKEENKLLYERTERQSMLMHDRRASSYRDR